MVLLLLLIRLPVLAVSVQPLLRSSVDDYKTVCINEKIIFQCTIQQEGAQRLLTWSSPDYIPGTNIQFSRSINTRGDGKLVPLINGGATLSQLILLTDQVLEANLIIDIFNTTRNAVVTCINEETISQSSQRSLILAGIPQPPTLQLDRNISLQTEVVYFFSISPPASSNETDIEFYEITVIDFNVTLQLTNDSISFVLPLPRVGGISGAEICAVAIDRCRQRSVASSVIVEFYDPLLISSTTMNGQTCTRADASNHLPNLFIAILITMFIIVISFVFITM